ncbi:unnamed protein product [Clonostachys byssicola]|uniref:Uncharacterized protein n=1 Tax=Clonostachys byssicola TaxID=160290 RepID=A0A9N9UTD4_9HYPO|nr:unnamed protein product [Clonostachys byssicola]
MSFSYILSGILGEILGRRLSRASKGFLDARGKWQEACTSESILADYADYLLYGNPKYPPRFTSSEVQALKTSFLSHAKDNNYWDVHSFESFLLTRMPPEGKCRSHLVAAIPSLWMLTTHFAQWPFIRSASSIPTTLTFPALVRAVAFLSGRHSMLFVNWDYDDAHVERTDQLVLEYIFRPFATVRSTEEETATCPPLNDIIDILNTVQPAEGVLTDTLNRAKLAPIAARISSKFAIPEVSDLVISSSKVLAPLLDLCVLLLQHATKFDGEITTLIEYLEAAQFKPKNHTGEVSFEVFTEWLGKNPNQHHFFDSDVYDAIALVFNTFLNPEILTDGIMTHFEVHGEKERKHMLIVFALRRPGLTGGGWL